jgi:hypothetical protein
MDRKQRLEENEKLFREVNERVEDVQVELMSGPDSEWVCECGDESCFEKLTVPLREYREVRAHDNWFLIKPGHEKTDVDRVVQRGDDYFVVEKDGI